MERFKIQINTIDGKFLVSDVFEVKGRNQIIAEVNTMVMRCSFDHSKKSLGLNLKDDRHDKFVEIPLDKIVSILYYKV